jgi:hypothetical protein
MKAETEAVWAERVEQWRGSGKTAPEFAADKPYASSTLQWAASRLRQTGRGGRKRRIARAGRTPDAGIELTKVVRRRERVAVTAAEDMVLEVAGARIAVRRGFDAALLCDVVQALRGAR